MRCNDLDGQRNAVTAGVVHSSAGERVDRAVLSERHMEQPRQLLRLCYIASMALCVALQPSVSMGETQTGRVSNLPTPEADIQQTIHDYILAHPEVLIESLQLAKRKQEDQLAVAANAVIQA
jgi:hypothetical protein